MTSQKVGVRRASNPGAPSGKQQARGSNTIVGDVDTRVLEEKLAPRSRLKLADPETRGDAKGRRDPESTFRGGDTSSKLGTTAEADGDRLVETFRGRAGLPDNLDRQPRRRGTERTRRGRISHGHGHHTSHGYHETHGHHHFPHGHHGHGHGHFGHGVHFGHRHHFLGFHFGGFGFHHGHWHFALVIGAPVVWYSDPYSYHYRHHHRYYHSWWDGDVARLRDWDERYAERASARFDLEGESCVELRVRTRDGTEFTVSVDPRYWDARDPGDLYAALWAELEEYGRLELEDRLDGRVYTFEAGQIQEIEAAPCLSD